MGGGEREEIGVGGKQKKSMKIDKVSGGLICYIYATVFAYIHTDEYSATR